MLLAIAPVAGLIRQRVIGRSIVGALAAADTVAAPLDLLLTDAALGVLNRVNPGG